MPYCNVKIKFYHYNKLYKRTVAVDKCNLNFQRQVAANAKEAAAPQRSKRNILRIKVLSPRKRKKFKKMLDF